MQLSNTGIYMNNQLLEWLIHFQSVTCDQTLQIKVKMTFYKEKTTYSK